MMLRLNKTRGPFLSRVPVWLLLCERRFYQSRPSNFLKASMLILMLSIWVSWV